MLHEICLKFELSKTISLMLKWVYKEDDNVYEILLGKLGQFTSLNFRQLDSVPDF